MLQVLLLQASTIIHERSDLLLVVVELFEPGLLRFQLLVEILIDLLLRAHHFKFYLRSFFLGQSPC